MTSPIEDVGVVRRALDLEDRVKERELEHVRHEHAGQPAVAPEDPDCDLGAGAAILARPIGLGRRPGPHGRSAPIERLDQIGDVDGRSGERAFELVGRHEDRPET